MIIIIFICYHDLFWNAYFAQCPVLLREFSIFRKGFSQRESSSANICLFPQLSTYILHISLCPKPFLIFSVSLFMLKCLPLVTVSQGKWKYPGRSHRNAIFKLEHFLTTAFQCKIWLTLILESCLGKDGRQKRNRRFSVGHRATQIWKVFQVRCHVKIEALRAVMHAWCHIRGK